MDLRGPDTVEAGTSAPISVSVSNTGSGHKWRLIDDQPWRRAYVVLKPGARDLFAPNRR